LPKRTICEDESLVIDAPVFTDGAAGACAARKPATSDAFVALADNRQVAEMLARMPNPYGEAEANAFIAIASRSSEAASTC
jgi:hypothetical protein